MVQPLTPEALIYDITGASDPQMSPDGQRIAYTLGKTDKATGKSESHIWVCDRDGSNKRRMTWAGQRHGWPRWSPDGKWLAFTSDRGGKQGLYVLPMHGGEARRVLTHPVTMNDLAWSQDGSRVAFTAAFDPANPGAEKPKDGAPPPVRVTSRIDYKQDTLGYIGEMRNQVYVADVPSGTSTMLTSDPYSKASPVWSPDGQWLLYRVGFTNNMEGRLRATRVDGAEQYWVSHERGSVTTWAWAPDGSKVLFAADPEHTSQADFYLFDTATRDIARVTTDLDVVPDGGFTPVVAPAHPHWLDADRAVFHGFHRGASGLWQLTVSTGVVTKLEGELEMRSGLSMDAQRRYAAQSVTSLGSVGEIAVTDIGAGARTVVTCNNEDLLRERPPASWERFDVTRDGMTIEAWLLHPPGFDPSKKYPLVLDIHGGPNGYYGYGFNLPQQVLASHGFCVVFCNPRGSTSYGRDFAMRVYGDWGGEDYEDIMAVVDEALKRPYIDPQRTGIYGYSYGGYMTAWTIARNHRFKAAVCGAPCFDLESMYGTSDISHFFGPLQWGGKPHEAREEYALHSPSQFAHNTRTPTLIIQGEADERCPVGQSEQMFVTLKMNGCEVEFVRYPGQSHLFNRVGPPQYREDYLRRLVDWFTDHLGSPTP